MNRIRPANRREQAVKRKPTPRMCVGCPFGSSERQRHMRDSLRPGRFTEIAQSVWAGAYFPCHKTTLFDDDGEVLPNPQERQCVGALEFVALVAANRENARKRSQHGEGGGT